MTTTIGKYQIQGEVGRGGFGTVYRAWDPTVHRSVAIKVLTVQGDEDMLTRFRNEAAAAGNLHHRNIVTIHDFGEHDGTPYMVMQLLEGSTIQELIATKRPLTLVQKMQIMGQVADGLHHAHLHGIVHRDVKPPNIMVLPDETVQIMDFGIARLTASASRQTRTGLVIGTVLYMAPEQFLPHKVVDHRADIWAYGVIYYELLSGTHPFAAAEETGVLYKIAHVDPAPLSDLCGDVPPSLGEVVQRLLAKEPELRYSSLRDVQFDVQPILVELKKDQAAQMLNAAHQLAGDERFEEAQAAAQEILELDPSNREAHGLLVTVKQRLQRRLIQPKIDGLLQRAEQEVQARSWQNAIDALESALRLSQTDPAIQVRVSQVIALQEKARKSERLLSDAQKEMRAQNLSGAFRMASEAAQTDPSNSSAQHLLSQIQREIDFREAQKRLQEGLGKARGLLLTQQVEEALVLLGRLSADFPEDGATQELLTAARQQKAQGERLARRQKDVTSIRESLREGRFGEAISGLELLLAGFPNDLEIGQLLTFARTEAEARRRSQAVVRARAEVDEATGRADFDGAVRVVESIQNEFPGDASLARLLESVAEARTEHEAQQRAESVSRILRSAGERERAGDLRAALDELDAGLREFEGAPALLMAADRLRPQVRQSDRKSAIARHVEGIERAIAEKDYKRALSLVEAARGESGGDRAFDALQARAAAAKGAADLLLAHSRIRDEIGSGNFGLALEMVTTALKRFPAEPGLLELERQARQEQERRAAEAALAAQKTREQQEQARAIAAAEERARAEAAVAAREAREERERQAAAVVAAQAAQKARDERKQQAGAAAAALASQQAQEKREQEAAAVAAADQQARADAARAVQRARKEEQRQAAAAEAEKRAAAAQKNREEGERRGAPAQERPAQGAGVVLGLPLHRQSTDRTEPPSPFRNRSLLYAGGAFAVTLAILLATMLLRPPRTPAPAPVTPRVTVQPPPAQPQPAIEKPVVPPVSAPAQQQPQQQQRPIESKPRVSNPPISKPAASKPLASKPFPSTPAVAKQNAQEIPSPQPEIPAQQAPPADRPPGNRVGDAGARVVGDSGARVQGARPEPQNSGASETAARPPNVVGDSGRSTPVWKGPATGKLEWVGVLPPGGRVVVSASGLMNGPGQITSITVSPGWSNVEITSVRGRALSLASSSGSVTVRTADSSLMILNTGSAPLRQVEVDWRVRQ